MSVPMHRQEVIARSRRLAAEFIKASDTFNALLAELTYLGAFLPEDQGGLTEEEFFGVNADLTPEDLLLFYDTMGQFLQGLSDEQKRAVYRLKGSATLYPAVPPPPPPLQV